MDQNTAESLSKLLVMLAKTYPNATKAIGIGAAGAGLGCAGAGVSGVRKSLARGLSRWRLLCAIPVAWAASRIEYYAA